MTTINVTGTDNKSPVYDPYGLWKRWSMDEIWRGGNAAGKWIPKINDYILDLETNLDYRVTDIDFTTGFVTWVPVKTVTATDTLTDEDVLLGVGPGRSNETMRCYLDTRVMPHDLSVEGRLKVHGSAAAVARIFRGSVLDSSQHVISMFFDASGNMLGQDIPLELAKDDGNVTTKCVPPCKTTETMQDGEVVTVVIYSAAGAVLSKCPLLVENTGFISSPNDATKYIKEYYLESPFMSTADDTLLLYPINVTQDGLSLMGVVKYTDGTELRMPVDGTKFSLMGFENYATQRVGVEIPLVFKYQMSADEVAYGFTVGPDRFLTRNYRARTETVNGAYTVKLYCYPVWIDAANGYRLEWFMADLERTKIWLVTPYVKINQNSASFKPTQYGTTQRLSYSINLQDVNGAFTNHIHNETFDLTLLAPGTDRTQNWAILFDASQTNPYGLGNSAKTTFVNQNLYRLDLKSNCDTQDAWLEKFFYNTMPLHDFTESSRAPAPTHFAVEIGEGSVTFPVSEWNVLHDINFALPNSGTVFLRFFQRTPDNDIQLSVAGVPIYQQN